MEKPEYKSKWDELVREIGVEIPPEIEQREQAVSSSSAAPPTPSREAEPAVPHTPPPKKTPVNWDALAGELGLPPAPPEERPAAPAEEARRPVRETSPRAEPPKRETPPREKTAEAEA